ncbi:aspartate-semialdehyde dehydrogenase [Salpingoeca rosetta]|uniref:aspartate-semialdehyde dehydrogenase n=1 Tax=Salpingoeca rosetta (strain ATCC 50818 / BSB-021) TaxID=946362 RepID=F2TWX0_SALR5|nr:aspartate-semialdehyde dehydrogenase [Salpingoeca rosetta]EGD72566.1 aspartate-semialdehyde dehydrogenase [Salpingoeca rosetta]|eukprot:XP_004999135.1 aspartate-semialdehyde dehydrogenase [Salpingoeca rosetta]
MSLQAIAPRLLGRAMRDGLRGASVAFAQQQRHIGTTRVALAGAKNGLERPNVAIAGVTGAVGVELLNCLDKRNFPFNNLKLLASARSAGKEMVFQGKKYVVEELTDDSFEDVDIALFSAGGSQSKRFAPSAVDAGCVVIDNSSAFRMDPHTPLVVPEVNPEAAAHHNGIIANPNCSTIIMNVAVWPLYKLSRIRRIVAATYQAASGAGAAAMRELEQQAVDWSAGKELKTDIFGRQYLWNLFSHNSAIDPTNGYNEEEVKMIRETKKIFTDDNLHVTATCIRVPVLRAHCEAINLTFSSPVSEEEVRAALAAAPGVLILDDRQHNQFPEPLLASGEDDVLVGRIRPDLSQPHGMGYELFIAGDQLLKGAALNAVQIAELLLHPHDQ